MPINTPFLDKVKSPRDIKKIARADLPKLADDVRQQVIDAVSKTGGHLGAGLGVVELTVALHYVFNTPYDRVVWDVGHQCYPHKVLTERRDQIYTLRQGGGLSGFTKRSESEYDPFGAAHSSTSISSALGMAVARDKNQENREVIAVIGDGSISAGMAYEAMNNAGALKSKLIVILNDNDMSIAPPVGAVSRHLNRLTSSNSYRFMREAAKKVVKHLPEGLERFAARAEESLRGVSKNGPIFEELGFYYLGPIDGHNLDELVPVLENVRDSNIDGPVLIHAITQKGKGYQPAEDSDDKYHGVAKFDVASGKQDKPKPKAVSYTQAYADQLIKLAKTDDKIIGITAAMPSGTGMDKFGQAFPDRTYDVGIAEQHAVTFAAGLATEGFKPFATIYSTFLQRAYDQVVHDVAIQKLPVRFAMDRAGLVGADGSTHAGSFDIAYLGCLPHFILMAASDELELARMVSTAHQIDDAPSAFRYPRGNGWGLEMPETIDPLTIGKGRIVKEGSKIAILSYGGRLSESLKAAEKLDAMGLSTTVADARFAKPLDTQLIQQLVKNHQLLLTIEEGSIGGFGSFVAHYLHQAGLLDQASCLFRSMTLPDIFIDQDKPDLQYQLAKLDSESIIDQVFMALSLSTDLAKDIKHNHA